MSTLDLSTLRQGAVLRGGRLFVQNSGLYSLVKRRGRLRVLPASELAEREQTAVLPSVAIDLAVITQSCDIRKSDHLVLAPVFALADPTKPLDKGEKHLLRNHGCTWAYYLRGSGDYPESYIDGRYLCTVHASVVRTFSVVYVPTARECEEIRRFLFNYFGRPGIEDDVVQAAKPVFNAARKPRISPNLHSFWIDQHSRPIRLLAVFYESDPSLVADLEQAESRANAGNGSLLKVSLHCKLRENVSLADLEGYVRLGWDNLSFGGPQSTVTD